MRRYRDHLRSITSDEIDYDYIGVNEKNTYIKVPYKIKKMKIGR